MLELAQVVSQINEMGREARSRHHRLDEQMAVALELIRRAASDWPTVRASLGTTGTSPWPMADLGDEPPGAIHDLPSTRPPSVYTALATDGSHIPIDRHAVAPCYLLNVGEIAIHYGTGERPVLTSTATLHFKEEEIFERSGAGDSVPLSERIVSTRRFLAESASLAALIAAFHERYALALVDAPLIVWTPQGEPDEQQRRVIAAFCEMLEAGRQATTPVAGYISRPGHRDVAGVLRRMLCSENCDHATGRPCRSIPNITDAHLFSRLLTRPGMRSPVFDSAAPNLSLYPEAHRIEFFYLNVGSEIARVEVPRWVGRDGELLTQVHALVFDQTVKGRSYPVALAEAHERAVVRGAEREAFFRLVEDAFVRNDVKVNQTRKAVSKRMRIV